MRDRWTTGTAVVAALGLGVAAWAGVGDLTLTEALPGARRVGLLPPWWWLGVAVAAAAGALVAVRAAGGRWLPLAVGLLMLVPWLPGPWPVATLAWVGPLAAFLMASAMAAAFASRTPRETPPMRAWSGERRGPLVACAAALIVYLVAGRLVAPVLPAGDEPHYLVITQSLLSDGDLAIENNHTQGDYRAYINQTLRPDYLRRGTDGKIYSIHLPGTSALVAPAFAIGGYPAAKIWLSILAAVASAFAWRVAFVVTGSAAAAWFGWAATAVTAPFLFLAFTVYPDGPGSLCVTALLWAIVSLSRRHERPAAWWLTVGAVAAALPWLHPRFTILAAAAGVVFVLRARRDAAPLRAIAAFLALPTASAVAWFGYYFVIYGTPNPSVAYGYYTQMAVTNVGRGLLGLLFDQQFGVFATAPVFAVTIPGLVILARERRRLAIEWMAIVVPYVAVSAMYHMWWGGQSSPARFLGAVMLPCALPVAVAWARATTAASRATTAVLLAVSVSFAVMLVGVGDGSLVFNSRDGLARWALWATRSVDLARGLPSVFRTETMTTFAVAACWSVGAVAAWLVVRAAERRAALSRGGAAAAVVAALVIAASSAMTASWRIEGANALAPAAGQGRLLERAASADAAFAVLSSPYSLPQPGPLVRELRLAGDSNGKPPWACYWQAPLPAGRYRLAAIVKSRGSALNFDVVLGRGDVAVESWSIDADRPGSVSHDFVLPRAVRSFALRPTSDTKDRVSNLVIEPVLIPVDRTTPRARINSTVRYGETIVMGVGDAVYVERQGAWVKALVPAEVLIVTAPERGVQHLRLRAGPVATGVSLETSGWRTNERLAAGEERDVEVPLVSGRATVRVQTDAGFRPASVDPTSADTRHLGVWLEFR